MSWMAIESWFIVKRWFLNYFTRRISVSLVLRLLKMLVVLKSNTRTNPLSNPTASYFASALKQMQRG